MKIFPRGGTPEERFWTRVTVSDGCWEWAGNRIIKGYGNLWLPSDTPGKKNRVYAHRFSYELHFGPIPDGLFVCHRCDNPACVNPAHLFLGDALVNIRDARDKGRLWAQNHRPPRCKKGHTYESGRRVCGVCSRANQARYNDRHRERRNAKKCEVRRRRKAAL